MVRAPREVIRREIGALDSYKASIKRKLPWKNDQLLPMVACMIIRLATFVVFFALWPMAGRSAVVGYSLDVTTAYATADPFANRLDQSFTETSTGYFQLLNTGTATFSGTVGTIAVSAFAGDLSFTSGLITLAPGNSVSVAIPDDSRQVGGFNGPAYFFRPGVEITLSGVVSDGISSQPVSLLVADADIHSGVPRTDGFGLTSDSFVLQGGDPWGFDAGAGFALGQANGVYTFAAAVPEPRTFALLATGLGLLAAQRRGRRGVKAQPEVKSQPGSPGSSAARCAGAVAAPRECRPFPE